MSKASTSPRNAGKSFGHKSVDFLIANAGVITAKTIAGRLGRTTKAVRRQAEKLGLSLSV